MSQQTPPHHAVDAIGVSLAEVTLEGAQELKGSHTLDQSELVYFDRLLPHHSTTLT